MIPIGLLTLLPLHAAGQPPHPAAFEPDHRHLGLYSAIRYAPNTRALRRCRATARKLDGRPGRLLAIDVPDGPDVRHLRHVARETTEVTGRWTGERARPPAARVHLGRIPRRRRRPYRLAPRLPRRCRTGGHTGHAPLLRRPRRHLGRTDRAPEAECAPPGRALRLPHQPGRRRSSQRIGRPAVGSAATRSARMPTRGSGRPSRTPAPELRRFPDHGT